MTMEQKTINSIRFLGVDAINRANSGHPGIVLGAAPMAYQLFSKHLKIDIKNPKWINRDRFILSAGHGSMLLYAINHLAGYKISIDDIKSFRQVGNTPGHPEFGHTEGVETTSGPLGQGIANAVGMAIAEAHLGARFNKPGFDIINHYTYVICGDGDLQEGVALEALSLAGHLKLSKLIILHDSNDIQLDGEVKFAHSENHKQKFEAMGFQYLYVEDGNDLAIIHQTISEAKNEKNKPTIIEIKTIIGFGSKNAGTSKVHGSPIGNLDTVELRKALNWDYDPFIIPGDIYEQFQHEINKRGQKEYNHWKKTLNKFKETYPSDYDLFFNFFERKPVLNLENYRSDIEGESDATRNISGKIIQKLSREYLNLIGGSADLTSSTKAKGADGHFLANNYLARNINFGVREHAMGSISNGMVLHGGLKVFAGGFFVFSDYMKPAIRLAALMQLPTIFVFTHDSIAVGEDGPTHQPIEQLVGLRAIPNLNVIRPADANETLAAWKIAIESETTPTVIVLTRQNLTNYKETSYEGVNKGAYIVSSEIERLDGILLATGSEVELAIQAKTILNKMGKDVRVVSMPSSYLFDKSSKKYKNKVLPKSIKSKTIAIEMGSSLSWYKYTNNIYAIDTFGLSAPQNVVMEHFGFTKEKLANYCSKILK
jgi:transketolase